MSCDTVDLWHIPLDTKTTGASLSGDERERAQKFRFPIHRTRFIAARHALRTVLGRYLDRTPASIRFAYGPHGKPFVSGVPLSFNLSHSAGKALLAVCWKRHLGVDLEQMRPAADLSALAERYFAPAEADEIRTMPSAEQVDAFYRCWTRKEAYIKARGEGLAIPLDSFTVPTGPEPSAYLLSSQFGHQEVLRWKFLSVPCASGFTGALAVENGAREIQIHHYEFPA